MRRHSIYTEQRGPLDIKMTPMIDVVFLLLIFFVWTASFRIAEYSLPSSLTTLAGSQPLDPELPPPPEADFEDVVIRILWADGRVSWEVNDTPVDSLVQVRQQLHLIAEIKQDAPVILHPDEDVPLGHVIDVYDAARLENFSSVGFATAKEI